MGYCPGTVPVTGKTVACRFDRQYFKNEWALVQHLAQAHGNRRRFFGIQTPMGAPG